MAFAPGAATQGATAPHALASASSSLLYSTHNKVKPLGAHGARWNHHQRQHASPETAAAGAAGSYASASSAPRSGSRQLGSRVTPSVPLGGGGVGGVIEAKQTLLQQPWHASKDARKGVVRARRGRGAHSAGSARRAVVTAAAAGSGDGAASNDDESSSKAGGGGESRGERSNDIKRPGSQQQQPQQQGTTFIPPPPALRVSSTEARDALAAVSVFYAFAAWQWLQWPAAPPLAALVPSPLMAAAAAAAATIIVTPLLCLILHPAVNYGVKWPLLVRAAFGTRAARVVTSARRVVYAALAALHFLVCAEALHVLAAVVAPAASLFGHGAWQGISFSALALVPSFSA